MKTKTSTKQKTANSVKPVVMGRKKIEQEVQDIFNTNLSREEEKKRVTDLIFSLL